jgi:hypothetical protein
VLWLGKLHWLRGSEGTAAGKQQGVKLNGISGGGEWGGEDSGVVRRRRAPGLGAGHSWPLRVDSDRCSCCLWGQAVVGVVAEPTRRDETSQGEPAQTRPLHPIARPALSRREVIMDRCGISMSHGFFKRAAMSISSSETYHLTPFQPDLSEVVRSRSRVV